MSNKSHASLEQRVCQVCGTPFDTGSILLDKRLRANLEDRTTTGWGLCPEHQKLFSDGYIALIEFDPKRSAKPTRPLRMNPESAYRTGKVAHIKRELFDTLFSEKLDADQACVFAELGLIDCLETMIDPESK